MGIVVLLQSGKGGGLAGIASGGATQMLGTRQAPDTLEKATWWLAGIFVALCITTNFFINAGEGGQESIIQQNLDSAPIEINGGGGIPLQEVNPATEGTAPSTAPVTAPAGEPIPIPPAEGGNPEQ